MFKWDNFSNSHNAKVASRGIAEAGVTSKGAWNRSEGGGLKKGGGRITWRCHTRVQNDSWPHTLWRHFRHHYAFDKPKVNSSKPKGHVIPSQKKYNSFPVVWRCHVTSGVLIDSLPHPISRHFRVSYSFGKPKLNPFKTKRSRDRQPKKYNSIPSFLYGNVTWSFPLFSDPPILV